MKNLLITTMLFLSMGMFAQTHARKTRSDKGKTHSHTTKYYAKKAVKTIYNSSTTKTTTRRKKK